MKRLAVAGMLIVMTVSPALAVTHGKKTSILTVKGSVSTNCSLTTSPVTFPNIGIGYLHSPGNTIVTQSSLAVRCTKGAVVQITMNNGLYGSRSGTQFGARSMKSSPGNAYLGYDLCHDSGCASYWTPQGFSYTSPSDAGSSLPVWGRIKTGQQMDTGNYSDSVTVTVSF